MGKAEDEDAEKKYTRREESANNYQLCVVMVMGAAGTGAGRDN